MHLVLLTLASTCLGSTVLLASAAILCRYSARVRIAILGAAVPAGEKPRLIG